MVSNVIAVADSAAPLVKPAEASTAAVSAARLVSAMRIQTVTAGSAGSQRGCAPGRFALPRSFYSSPQRHRLTRALSDDAVHLAGVASGGLRVPGAALSRSTDDLRASDVPAIVIASADAPGSYDTGRAICSPQQRRRGLSAWTRRSGCSSRATPRWALLRCQCRSRRAASGVCWAARARRMCPTRPCAPWSTKCGAATSPRRHAVQVVSELLWGSAKSFSLVVRRVSHEPVMICLQLCDAQKIGAAPTDQGSQPAPAPALPAPAEDSTKTKAELDFAHRASASLPLPGLAPAPAAELTQPLFGITIANESLRSVPKAERPLTDAVRAACDGAAVMCCRSRRSCGRSRSAFWPLSASSRRSTAASRPSTTSCPSWRICASTSA